MRFPFYTNLYCLVNHYVFPVSQGLAFGNSPGLLLDGSFTNRVPRLGENQHGSKGFDPLNVSRAYRAALDNVSSLCQLCGHSLLPLTYPQVSLPENRSPEIQAHGWLNTVTSWLWNIVLPHPSSTQFYKPATVLVNLKKFSQPLNLDLLLDLPNPFGIR